MVLTRVYPHEKGWTVHPEELSLPPSKLDICNPYNFNNHHLYWTEKKFARFVISQTIRDLETSQWEAPKDIHTLIHQLYMPAPMPSLGSMLDKIEEAQDLNLELRYGTIGRPHFQPITDELLQQCYDEYDSLSRCERTG